jgi:hypothetical protein
MEAQLQGPLAVAMRDHALRVQELNNFRFTSALTSARRASSFASSSRAACHSARVPVL